MTKTLRFFGHSDDTFGEYAVTRDDYDNCANEEPIRFLVEAGEDWLVVRGTYDRHGEGTWPIGVELAEEGAALPAWPIRLAREHSYSHALEIDVPDDVRVVCLNRKTDEE